MTANRSTGFAKLFFEPVVDNQVIEYSYDGTEKHAPKPTLNETTAEMTCRIDWRSILGPDDTLEPLYNIRNMRLKDEKKNEPEKTVEQQDSEHAEKVKDMLEPDAGPWANVAKQLHVALAEVNNLLDVVRIAKDGHGIKVATVAPQVESQSKAAEEAAASKIFTWTANRRAILESKQVFAPFLDSRREPVDLELFYKELREIRKYYVVRKHGESLIGDLGYRTYGNKWIASESFDIYRVEEGIRSNGLRNGDERVKTMIEVDVPRHLAVRTSLFVSIVFDKESEDLFLKRDIRIKKRKREQQSHENDGNNADDASPNEDMIEEMESRGEKLNFSRMAYWANALRWARDTLVYRDLFTQLTRECATLVGRSCSIQDNIMVVNLFENVMLKVEKCESPFVDGELGEHGDGYLKCLLKTFFFDELRVAPYKPAIFVSLPNQRSDLPDAMAGAFAKEASSIERSKSKKVQLIKKIVAVASHFYLTKKVLRYLTDFQQTFNDPVLGWRWQRITTECSTLFGNFYLRGQETNNSTSFTIRISKEDVHIIPRDGHPISCGRDAEPFFENLHLLRANFLINIASNLCVKLKFEVLQINMNQYDSQGRPAPTIFVANTNFTRHVFMQFFSDGQLPSLAVRQIMDYLPDDKPLEIKADEFTPLDWTQFLGSTFTKQLETVLSFLVY